MQFNYQFSSKDLRKTKILVHILTGRLKIKDIKKVFKNTELLLSIKEDNDFDFEDIITLTKLDFVFLIKFVNEYTKYQRITNEFLVQYVNDLINRFSNDINLVTLLKPLLLSLKMLVL